MFELLLELIGLAMLANPQSLMEGTEMVADWVQYKADTK